MTVVTQSLAWVICILIAAMCSEYCSADNMNLEIMELSSAKVTINNQIISYERKEVEYLFQAGEAKATEDRDIYTIQPTEANDLLIKIQVSEGPYLYINESKGSLLTTESESEASSFLVSPIDSVRFHLYEATGIHGLVTPKTRIPFSFYLQRRYPHEPLAVFSFRQATVEDAYANKRENLNTTLANIRDSHFDKEVSYVQLLKLMTKNSHVKGVEIFTVAKYITEDLGVENSAFLALPNTVQLLFQGVGLRLLYNNYTMKYSWTSDFDLHETLRPYAFTQHETSGLWAITYSTNSQLTTSFRNPLIDIESYEKQFVFQLYYQPRIGEASPAFRILCFYSSTGEFNDISHTKKPTTDSTFHCTPGNTYVYFRLESFEV